MNTIKLASKQAFTFLFLLSVSVTLLSPPKVLAQEEGGLSLDEVTVTAQRREQTLKDVPIAIEVFGGAEIQKQGFRNLDDLANFSPTVLIEPRVQDQDVSIRGFGTTGNALTLDQATPFFVDGVHHGRQSQVKLAFLDVDSLEVLKGPQPVYFGQNATAGAFNIRSRRPTDTWEGYVNAELGSNETQKLSFGVGGPINEKWGVRFAGMSDKSDGYLDYVVTGQPYGAYENTGGRVMLQFTPNDQLQITAKFEAARIRKDSETFSMCRTDGPLIFARGGPLDDAGIPPGDERSVWDQATGTAWTVPFTPLDTSCFSSKKGVSQGGPYYEPPATIREENSNFGSVDARQVADGFAKISGNNGILGYEDLDSTSGYIDIDYALVNGMSLEWLTAVADYQRDYSLENSDSPFLMNYQGRGEDFGQFSSELRLRSEVGGKVEWEVGAFHQTTDLKAFSSSLRGNVRQSQRFNSITEDVDFTAVFASVTFNVNDKLAIDVGGRYQDNKKFATVEGYAGSWIFAVCPEEPCDPNLTPSSVVFDPVLDDYAGCEGDIDGDVYCLVDPATARMFVDVPAGTQLYAMPYRESRDVPPAWLSGTAIPVGLTAPDYAIRVDRGEGPYAETFKTNGFNPQVTLRYAINDNLTFYARYAESTKIGGFDTGQTSIPRDLEELTFGDEDAQQIELGLKGTLMDRRFGFDVDIFELEVPNLQISGLSPDPEQTSASFNAGQRVRGLEFNTRFAATDHLILGFSGAVMDGIMTQYVGAGCTDAEIAAALTDANAPCKLFDGDTRVIPPPDIDPVDAVDDYDGYIDRSGSRAPRSPEWKFVLSANFTMPIGNDYEFMADAKGYISDGYILDVEGFNRTVSYEQHEDLNVLVGIRSLDKGWAVSAFARNLLEARPSYNSSYDPFPNGLESTHISPSSFTTYGVKFEYIFE